MKFREIVEESKTMLLLAYPICLSQMGHIMVGIVDTAMVGQIGTTEQAAVSLANNLFVLILVFAIGISYGVTPLVAEADGSKDNSLKKQLLASSLAANLIFSLVFFAIFYFSSPILIHLDQPTEVGIKAIPFFNILIFSLIPLSLFMSYKQFAEGLSFTKVGMVFSIGGNLLNIVLNYILIYGMFGFPEMGYIGSAWASFISRCAMAAGFAVWVTYDKDFILFSRKLSIKDITSTLVKKIFNIGIPSGFQFLFEAGAFVFAAIMIGWIGEKEIAAHQIALNIAAFTYMIGSGISAATTIRVGNNVGLRSIDKVRVSGFAAFFTTLVFMGCTAVLIILFKEAITVGFTKDSSVAAMASGLLIIASLFQLSDGTQVVAQGALRGIKDVKIPTLITLMAYWAIALPLGYFMGFVQGYGIMGIWNGLSIGLTLNAILLVLRFNYLSKQRLL